MAPFRLPLALALVAVCGALAGCTGSEAPADRTLDVKVVRYVFEPGTNLSLNVTKGETILLRLTSLDVTHGFAITEYGIHVEVPPGREVEVRFTANKEGDFTIYCTVFCGSGHPQHKGTLHVAA